MTDYNSSSSWQYGYSDKDDGSTSYRYPSHTISDATSDTRPVLQMQLDKKKNEIKKRKRKHYNRKVFESGLRYHWILPHWLNDGVQYFTHRHNWLDEEGGWYCGEVYMILRKYHGEPPRPNTKLLWANHMRAWQFRPLARGKPILINEGRPDLCRR